jgi:Domain of unknown function (DUF6089)
MGRKNIILLLFVFLFISQVDAQRWKKYRYEFSYGLGLTNFMGDVGAPEQKLVTQYFWVNPYFFRPIGNVGLGYVFHERVHAKANLHLGWISGNDSFGEWRTRRLKFSSFLLETSFQAEIYIVKEKRKRNIYRSSKRFRRKLQSITVPTYLFVGFGGSLVNTNLQYIGANVPAFGDGTTLGKKTTFTGTIPIGIGFRYRLTNRINMGLEASLRYTLSDNVDNHKPPTGQWIDAYQFLTFSMNYKLKSARSGLPRFKMSY